MELEKENQRVGEQGVPYKEKTMTNTHSASLFESYIMYDVSIYFTICRRKVPL